MGLSSTFGNFGCESGNEAGLIPTPRPHKVILGIRARWVLLLLVMALFGCGQDNQTEYSSAEATGEDAPLILPELSPIAQQGKEVFAAKCSDCHGPNADGTSEGPPLVHIIYEPNHHADISFLLAVRQGVRQHHWEFGNMDPVAGVSEEQVRTIVCFVRELQYANDIFDDPNSLGACQP